MGRGINNNNNVNSNNVYNFNFFVNGGTTDASTALNTITQSPYFQQFQGDTVSSGGTNWNNQIPGAACLPEPNMNLSSPPAGRGLRLTDGSDGFPAGSTAMAGGYTFVAKGNTAGEVFAPGQKPGDNPYFKWDGDPHGHLLQPDGSYKTVDFTGTKGLNPNEGPGLDLTLGNGARMFIQTTADTGHPVTNAVTIQNGQERVTYNNMQGKPTTDGVHNDGYEWRATHLATEGDRATWSLQGTANNDHAIQSRHGVVDGEVVGSKDVNGTYQSVIDSNTQQIGYGQGMRPAFGTRAWGDMLRDYQVDRRATADGNALQSVYNNRDLINSAYGNQTLPNGWTPAQAFESRFLNDAIGQAERVHGNDIQGRYQSDVRQFFTGYGGWPTYFGNQNSPWQALSMFRDLLLSDNQWQRQLQFGQYVNV